MSLPTKMLERVPFFFLVYTFVSGLTFLFLSPIKFFLPSWLTSLFIESPSEAFGVFLSIILFSFCLGIPFFLAQPLISEANYRGRKAISSKARIEENLRDYFSRAREVEFWKWAREHNYTASYDFWLITANLLNGLLVGSEVALILDFLVVLGSFFVGMHVLFQEVVVLLGFSAAIFLLSLLYKRYRFRGKHMEIRNSMRCDFIGHHLRQKGKDCFIVKNEGKCPIKYRCCKNELDTSNNYSEKSL